MRKMVEKKNGVQESLAVGLIEEVGGGCDEIFS